MSHANTTGTSQAQTENSNSRPKQRTIIRLLSTKFTPRAPNAAPANQPPPPPPSAAAKEQRDAALRAVGLLPPLRPNKDLSRQEMEQDQHIPVVPLPQSEVSSSSDPEAASTTESQPSAADLIRKEWVTKNQPTSPVESSQLDRLTTFKFGGSTPSLVVPPPSSDPDSVEPERKVDGSPSHASPDQLDTPMLTSSLSPDHSGSVPPSRDSDIRPQETSMVAPTAPMSNPSPPPSPLLDIPPEIRAYMSTNPPSRKGSSSSLRSAPSSPPPERELPPLPPQTQTQNQIPTVPEIVLSQSKTEVECLMDDAKAVPSGINIITPQSTSIPSGESGSRGKGNGTESGTSTPRPNVVESNALELPSISIPAIEIESPATSSGKDAVAETDDTKSLSEPAPTPAQVPAPVQVEEEAAVATLTRRPSDSDDVSSPSISSITTPSLDSSQTTASSSNEALNSPTPKPLLLAPGKLGTLQVKTTGAEKAPPVVIASPVEAYRFSEELEAVIEIEDDGGDEVTSGVIGTGEVKVETEQAKEMGKEGEGEAAKGAETPKASKPTTEPASAPPTTLTFQTQAATANANLTPKKAQVDRRRTLNPFKRAQTVGPGTTKAPSNQASLSPDTASSEPKRRLTVGSSFSSIRKSVVGTLSSKSKTSGSGSAIPRISTSSQDVTPKKGKMFDASHLPPSPTIPSSFVGSLGSRGSGGSTGGVSRGGFGAGGSVMGSRVSPPPTPTRLARPVVMHTGGSILEQTAGIEDAETRRMTELAFM